MDKTSTSPRRRAISVRVTKNIYGNMRGYITGQQSEELGCSEFLALEWLAEALASNPGATLLASSYLGAAELAEHAAASARMDAFHSRLAGRGAA